jgi:WD40 repeat protein
MFRRDVEAGDGGGSTRRQLTFKTHAELGELKGAIARRAETTWQALVGPDPEAAASLPEVLRALVTTALGDAVTARPARLDEFGPEGSPARRLVDRLLTPEARLLIAEGDASQSSVRLAHEALIVHWPRARDQIQADRRDIETRAKLEALRSSYEKASSSRDQRRSLLTGLALEEGRELQRRWRTSISPPLSAFVSASAKADAQRRRRVITAAAAAVIVFAVLAAVSAWFGNVAEVQRSAAARSAAEAVSAAKRAQDSLAAFQLADSQRLAPLARRQTARGNGDLGALIALKGLPSDYEVLDRPRSRPLEYALAEALSSTRPLANLEGGTAGAFSPDGATFAVATGGGWIRLHRTDTWQTLGRVSGSSTLAFSPDSRFIATGVSGAAVVYDVQSREAVHRPGKLGSGEGIMRLAFSRDGRTLFAADGSGGVSVADTSDWTVSARDGPSIVDVATSAENGLVATTGILDGAVVVRSLADLAVVATLRPGGWVTGLAFGSGDEIATVNENGAIRLWDGRTGRLLLQRSIGFATNYSKIGHVEGKVYAVTSKTAVTLIDLSDPSLQKELSPGFTEISRATMDGFGRFVVAGKDEAGVAVLQTGSEGTSTPLLDREARFSEVAVDPSGRLIAGLGLKGVTIWSADTSGKSKPEKVLPQTFSGIRQAELSSDGKMAALLLKDDGATVYAVPDSGEARELDTPDGSRLSGRLAVSRSGKFIAASTVDGQILVWNGADPERRSVLRLPFIVNSMFFLPDERRLAVSSRDKHIHVYDIESGKRTDLATTNAWVEAGASPDGRFVEGTDRRTDDSFVPVIFDLRTGDRRTIEMPGGGAHTFSGFLSNDIFVVASDTVLVLHDPVSGKELTRISDHSAPLINIDMSPDNSLFVSGDQSGLLVVRSAKDFGITARLRLPRKPNWIWPDDGASGLILVRYEDDTFEVWSTRLQQLVAGATAKNRLVESVDWKQGRLSVLRDGGLIDHLDLLDRGRARAKDLERFYGDPAFATRLAAITTLRPMTISEEAASGLREPCGQLAEAPSTDAPSNSQNRDCDVEPPTAIAADSGLDPCDALAGNVFDPRHRGPGLTFSAMRDPERAIDACKAAVAQSPGEARFFYQLGRALQKAGRTSESEVQYRLADERGHPHARLGLASLLKEEKAQPDWGRKAVLLLESLADAGYKPAFADLGQALADGDGVPREPGRALSVWSRGAEAGDPRSHQALFRAYASGRDVRLDPERALGHGVDGVKLFRSDGHHGWADTLQVEVGSLARSLNREQTERVLNASRR